MNLLHTPSGTFNRTQIYLTAEQQVQLNQLSRQNACSKSELIRSAVDQFLVQQTQKGAEQQKQQTKAQAKGLGLLTGLWKDRDEMRDPAAYVR